MITTRNHHQFSLKQARVFMLQDNKGFHAFLQHPLTKKVEIKLEEVTEDNGKHGERAAVVQKAAFSAMTPKAQDRIVSCSGMNTMLKSQRSSTVTRKSQSPSLSAAKAINYYLSTGMLHVSEQNVLPILELSLRLGLTVVQEACTLLISKTLTIANWNEILRLARDYHSRSLTKTFTELTNRYIEKCWTRKDMISLLGALTHSKTDRQSLKFFLKRFLRSGNKKNLVKVIFEVFNSEAKMLQFCFKDCLDGSKLAMQDADDSIDATQAIKTKATQTQDKAAESNNQTTISPLADTRRHTDAPSSHQTYIDSRNITTEQRPDLSMSWLGCEHNRPKTTPRTDDKNYPSKIRTSHRPAVREIKDEQSWNVGNDYSSNDFHSGNVLKQAEERISCVKPAATSLKRQTTPFDNTHSRRREKGKHPLPKQINKNSTKFNTAICLPSDHFFILISGGITNEDKPEPTNVVFMYSQSTERWIKLPSMNSKRFNHSIVSIGGKVITIGGNTASREYRDSKMKCNSRTTKSKRDISISDALYRRNLLEPSQTNSVEQFSINNDVQEWSTVHSMILSREEHCSVVVGEQVYSIGGHDGICQLCSVERYDLAANRWSLEKPMSRLRTGACAVTDGRYIYVIGGYGGLQWLNTIECYDTFTKTWSRDHFPPMAERRGYACAEMLQNDIYVFGGTNGHENLKTCEVFNTKVKEWRKGPSMNEARLNAGHCVFNGRILVLGGESNGRFLDTVEHLDTVVKEWKPFCKLPVKVAGLKCTTVVRV